MIILFDGICNLCNGFVNFIIDRDSDAVFRFASLQSDFGQKIVSQNTALLKNTDSVILITNDGLLTKSDAAIEILSQLKGFRWCRILKIFPLGLRNYFYDLIARNRYRWFGKRDSCRIPTPDLVSRFL